MVRIAAYPKCFEYDIGLHHIMSVFEWVELAGRELSNPDLGLEGLEMYERFLPSFDREDVLRVREAVERAGFVVPMFICSPDFTDPDPGARLRTIDHQAEMVRVAAWLGGPGTVCRVLSGQARTDVSQEQGVAWVVGAIEELIPVAREHGVVLGMENHYKDSQWEFPEFALRKDVFLQIVEAIDERERFGVQYDPSNAIVAGDDPLELLAAVSDRVVSMHASDRHWREGVDVASIPDAPAMGYSQYLQHGVVGEGLNDYDAILATLRDAGFDGWISVEDGVNGIDEMRRSLAFLRRKRDQIWPS